VKYQEEGIEERELDWKELRLYVVLPTTRWAASVCKWLPTVI
jgi:hypothetical protein